MTSISLLGNSLYQDPLGMVMEEGGHPSEHWSINFIQSSLMDEMGVWHMDEGVIKKKSIMFALFFFTPAIASVISLVKFRTCVSDEYHTDFLLVGLISPAGS